MRRKTFWIAASCILSLTGLLPVLSSGASPVGKEKVLYSFTGGTDGGAPLSDLTTDNAGNIYGTTSRGGTGTGCNGGCGTVFELKRIKDGWNEQVLYSFSRGKDGAIPSAGVIFDSSGNLYGTTKGGGSSDAGTVFKLSRNPKGGWTESVIYTFDYSSSGLFPVADLAFDAHGSLYGTASQGGSGGTSCYASGCGTVFKLTPQSDGSWTETTIHVFTGGADGGTPSSGVVLDSAGSLYGATVYGGNGPCFQGCGMLYAFSPNSGGGWTETVIYNFVQGEGFGKHPSGQILFDNVDHLLGVTSAGGDGFGTVLELHNSQKRGWQENVLHIFYGYPGDGLLPTGRLVVNTEGDLFGVTTGGGSSGHGTVFELWRSKSGWKEMPVYAFTGSPDGANPGAGLVADSQGHLYGTTQYGGTGIACQSGCGTVFEVMH